MMNLKLTSIGLLSAALLAVGCNEKPKKEETTTSTEEKMVDTGIDGLTGTSIGAGDGTL